VFTEKVKKNIVYLLDINMLSFAHNVFVNCYVLCFDN